VVVHVTYVPILETTREAKTKPTQHSVKELRSIGLQPDAIVLRSHTPLEKQVLEKTSLFCDVPLEGIINSYDVESVYDVPLLLEQEKLISVLEERLFGITREADLDQWKEMVSGRPERTLNVALVGKYVVLPDAYLSVIEAIKHAAMKLRVGAHVVLLSSDELEKCDDEQLSEKLNGMDALVVPGGFGSRGIEGMVKVLRYARENKLPTLGLCLGMQVMSIEFARNMLGLIGANSTEFDPETQYPIISLLPEQMQVKDLGGSMRLGAYPCTLIEGTRVHALYNKPVVFERHRHRFEFNNRFREAFENSGMRVSGVYEPKNLVEILELKDHPFYVGVQYHPEFKSRPMVPHPLFLGLLSEALARHSSVL